MNPLQTALEIVAVLALVGWIGYRQSTWRAVDPGRMWRMPVLLGLVGVVLAVGVAPRITAIDVAILLVELAVSVGVGLWMGAIAHFRRLETPRTSSRSGAAIRYETRTSAWGLVLWALVIAARIGAELLAAGTGAVVAGSVGVVLILLAANRAARIAALVARLDRHALTVA